jgi:hypothetical protein
MWPQGRRTGSSNVEFNEVNGRTERVDSLSRTKGSMPWGTVKKQSWQMQQSSVSSFREEGSTISMCVSRNSYIDGKWNWVRPILEMRGCWRSWKRSLLSA